MWCGFLGWGFAGMMWPGLFILMGLGFIFWWGYRPQTTRYRDDPLDIARMRLARGDISLEEYEKIVKNM
jgi:uncharacterized membrane protein